MTRPVRALLLLLPALVASLPGCSRGAQPRSVVLVTIDTLRWDRLGCTGWERAHTPNIDRFAAAGTLLPNTVAAAPLTLPSHCTILTGLLPVEHGVRDNPPFRLPDGIETVADTFRARDYATWAVVAAIPLGPDCGLQRGFDVYDYEVERGAPGSVILDQRPANEVTRRAIDLLDARDPERPFFLFVHYFDPHWPYAPPSAFAARFPDQPYDGEVAFVDHELGRLLERIDAEPGLEPLIVITADHGESLGAHDEDSHGFFVYDATIRVPLLVRDPALPPGGVIGDQVRHQDLRAYLEARAAGLPFDLTAPAARGEPALVESLYGYIHCDFAQVRGLRAPSGMKYIESCEEELYALAEDRDERDDLAAARTAAVRASRDALAATLTRLPARMPEGLGPSLPGYLQTPLDPESVRTLAREENCAHPAPRSRIDSIRALHQAMQLVEADLVDAAVAMLDQALAQDAGNPSLHFWQGRAHMRAARMDADPERMAAAVRAFETTLERRPGHDLSRDLLLFCLVQVGRYDDALALAVAAEESGDAGFRTFEAMAKFFHTPRGAYADTDNPHYDFARGVEALARAVELGGERADGKLRQYLAECYRRLGRPLQATPRGP